MNNDHDTVARDVAQAADRTEDKVEHAARETADEVGDAARATKNKAKGAWDKTTDAVEDVIPGDSDGDGH